MRKLLLMLVLCIADYYQINAQVTTEWVNQPRGNSIATDAFNNVYTVDWDLNPAGDITLTKRSTSGNILWQVSYDNTDVTRHEVATWVATDKLGNVYVSGTIRSGYSNPVTAASILMKYDSNGNLLWRNVYETSFDGSYTKKILIDNENNVYVLGTGTGPLGYVTKVKKFAPDGSTIWIYYDGVGIGAPLNFKFTPDNNIIIIGRGIFGSVNGYAKIDLNGHNIWNYAGIYSLYIGDAAGDSYGNTYLTHQDYVFNGRGMIKKLSPTGTVIWERYHDIIGNRIEVGTDNLPVICGYPNTGFGAAFMKYDTSGNVVWLNLDADGPSYALMLHAQMMMDAQNSAYLAAGTLFDMAVCKVYSNGQSAWTQTATGGFAYAMDIGSDNNVYVVGGNTAKFVQILPVICNTPTNLFTSNITKTKARLNWDPAIGAIKYEIWGKKINTPTWKKTFVPGSKTFLVTTGLNCSTNYEWKIRTVCDSAGSNVSPFSVNQLFATSNCTNISETPLSEDQLNLTTDNIQIYPNPVKIGGSITIKNITEVVPYSIFSLTGQKLEAGYTRGGIIYPKITSSGIYVLELLTTTGMVRNKLLIIE